MRKELYIKNGTGLHPTYIVEFNHPLTDLVLAEIDPTKRMADIDQKNNTLRLNW